MEGTRPSGRWNKKASFGTTLLFMSMFIPTFASVELPVKNCSSHEYENKGICCDKCHAGTRLVKMCETERERTECMACSDGLYMEKINYSTTCFSCTQCKENRNEVQLSACEKHKNAVCGCKDGYYKVKIDSVTFECLKCKQCGPDEKENHTCTNEKDRECECKANYYKQRTENKCVPCKNCTSDCKDFCPTVKVTTGLKIESRHLTNIIVGVVTVVMVSLVVASLVTYIITKWLTKRRLQERASQQSDVFPDSLEVLVQNDETSDKGLKAIPQSSVSEQEPFNLPDCVPLEIKITDLIYTVLDLVPVLQVKQLVRSLGVTDTEIERAEMDHRACQEAHYQMLRVWAQRGSRPGAGGRGGLLHRPLMLELLDKLRKMHLGQAAEELETKYGIQ